MLLYDVLDRDRAGHCRALAEQGAGGAEREAGGVPDRRQRGRPHAPFDDQPVEGLEMLLFLFGHPADRLADRAVAEHGKLAGIDARRAVFAGMVDADHPRHLFARVGIAGQPVIAGPRRARLLPGVGGFAHRVVVSCASAVANSRNATARAISARAAEARKL